MSKQRSPWTWIPTIYIAEGLPYFAVNVLTVMMYNNLGVDLKRMAFFTSWLYLPWVIKPFWSPFIDLLKTKRWWIIAMQSMIAVALSLIAFLLPTSFFLSATLAAFWLTAFCSATHDIAADGYYMLELDSHQQAAFVGVRSTFYRIASVIGQGGLVMLAGEFETRCSSIAQAWSWIFLILGVFFVVVAFYHSRYLPVTSKDHPMPGVNARTIVSDFGKTFVTFFSKPAIIPALLFMLFYRLPEALCLKLVQPFMVAPVASGGLGLTTSQVGFANGTVGVIALLAGGIIGGIAISRQGLRKSLWPMALALTVPCAIYCWLAYSQTGNYPLICSLIAVEQFGYGYGFTAFMLYLIYFCQGENKTSHYAFCTAFMAMGMMLPGMIAGWLHEIVGGYLNFFLLVMVTCLATYLVCLPLRIDPEFGRSGAGGNGA